MTRVLVVDDQPFTAATVQAALAGRGLETRACGSARDALALVRDWQPDVAVLDLDLGAGPTGIDLAHALRRELPEVGLAMLTTYRDPRLAGAGLPALPVGTVYRCKQDLVDIALLVDTIRLLERAPLDRRSTEAMVTGPTAGLTDTQVEVLLMVGDGVTTAEIAARRGVSASAIEQTIARICDRLGLAKDPTLNQRVQLVQALNRLRGQVRSP